MYVVREFERIPFLCLTGDDTLVSVLSKERKEMKDMFREETKQLRQENTKIRQEDDKLRRQIVKMREEKVSLPVVLHFKWFVTCVC